MSTIESISILGGVGRNGVPDAAVRIDFRMGDIVSVVGPTGSGKTTLINDLELFANGDTPTRRRILINGQVPSAELRYDPSSNPIALITQHTTFLSDLRVHEFLATHAKVRSPVEIEAQRFIDDTLEFANQLTGEPVQAESRMTELSGGQTRALLIADATVICNTPIVLLDEVENAGINRSRALQLLRQRRKIFVFVTHDPSIALLSTFRIVMSEGRIGSVLSTSNEERQLAQRVTEIDDALMGLRERIRLGHQVNHSDMECRI